MPELPEVETVRKGIRPMLEGRELARVIARRRDLRRPLPPDFENRLTGRRVTAVGRRAKYLLVHLEDGLVLVIHLGMSGRLRVFDTQPQPGAHDHVLMETGDGRWLVYNDARRFGLMDLIEESALQSHPLFAGLGPEPLDPAFDGPALAARLKGREISIKVALLDQRTVAGLGNIYVSEALFRAGLAPSREAKTVTGPRAARLAQAIRDVLAEAIEAGGSSLRDHRQASGELGYFQHRFAVYGREGEPCPGCDCAEGVRRMVQAGRATFFCSKRQR